MSKKRVYELNVSYPLADYWMDTQKMIEKAVGRGLCNFSGAGCGERDLGWENLSKLECNTLDKTLTQLKKQLPDIEWSFTEVE